MSFSVEPDALQEFAEFLGYVSMSASKVKSFVSENTEMSIHEGGLIDYVASGHSNVVIAMKDRVGKMKEIAGGSGIEMSRVAKFYREIDAENAAEIDATYPDAKPYKDQHDPDPRLDHDHKNNSRTSPPESVKWQEFDSSEVVSELKIGDISSKVETLAAEIEETARTALTATSVTGTVRMVFDHVVGFDPIDWIRQWWTGDWKAWARCALVWDSCANGTELIGQNVLRATDSLGTAWEGQAAEAAEVYFDKFRDAIYNEADAFSALNKAYELLVEGIAEINALMNDVINTIFDIVFTILTLGRSKGILAAIKAAFTGGWANKLIGAVSYAGTLLSIAIDIVRFFETMFAAVELEPVPPCKFDALKGDNYEHPGHGEGF